jgi:hypothetical protein
MLEALDPLVGCEAMFRTGVGLLLRNDGGAKVAGVSRGVGGPDEAGEGDSTTHIL